MTRKPDIKGLGEYFRVSDKNSPRFFAGRQKLVSAIEGTVEKLRDDIEKFPISEVHPNQSTWLIQGAPGAGKTTLQWYLRKRWAVEQNGPVVVDVRLSQLSDQHELTVQIANAMLPGGADVLMVERTVTHSAGVNVKINASRTTSESTRRGPLELSDLLRLYHRPRLHWLRRLLPFGRRKTVKPRPIVLMLDEIQAMSAEAGEVLHDLHVGIAGLPLIPLLAGLAWSQERLAQAGISRFSYGSLHHLQTLGPLQPEEAAESVRLMLKSYYVTGKETEEIADWFARLSDGWPQHLYHYMGALASELAAKGGNFSEISRDSIQAVGDLRRQSYYRARLQNSNIGMLTRILADVAKLVGEKGCNYEELIKILNGRRWQEDLEPADVMPEDMKPQEFVQEMMRIGLIHRVDDKIIIPIPSFRQYLINRPYKRGKATR